MSGRPTGAGPSRAELWDARHAAHDPIESADADPTLVEVAATLTPGAALDLGSGDGRNAAALSAWLRRSLVNRVIDRSRVHRDELDIDAIEADWRDDHYSIAPDR
ncbi:MAG: hypothetical protein MUQ32_16270, partial [Chloroflexi bacterium]|nr:hypothetical protein [Chloroflexota bacterium]